MADAVSRERWRIASSQMALLANINKPKGRTPYKPSDFDPHAHKAAPAIKSDIRVLKALVK